LITQQVIVLGTVAGTVESVGHVALWRNCQCILVIHGVRDFIVPITSQVPVSLLTVYCVTFSTILTVTVHRAVPWRWLSFL